MHGNHHHQRTDLGGIISITTIAYLPLGHLCHAPPLQNPKYASDVNMPIVKQNDGTWVEKPFFIQRLQTFFFIFVTFFFTFFSVFIFFWNVFTSMGGPRHMARNSLRTIFVGLCIRREGLARVSMQL